MQNIVWHLGDDFKVLLPVLFLMTAIYQKFLKLKSFFCTPFVEFFDYNFPMNSEKNATTIRQLVYFKKFIACL